MKMGHFQFKHETSSRPYKEFTDLQDLFGDLPIETLRISG